MNNSEVEKREATAAPTSNPEGPARGASRHGRRRLNPAQARRAESSVNVEEIRELLELVASYGFSEFELAREGFRIRFRRGEPERAAVTGSAGESSAVYHPPVAAGSLPSEAHRRPAHSASGAEAESASGAAAKTEELHTISSPIVGTFYRSPSPASEAFVRVGSEVEPGTVVCIIEAMKLMNEIQAETTGTIERIYVENGQAVEYGQALFGVSGSKRKHS